MTLDIAIGIPEAIRVPHKSQLRRQKHEEATLICLQDFTPYKTFLAFTHSTRRPARHRAHITISPPKAPSFFYAEALAPHLHHCLNPGSHTSHTTLQYLVGGVISAAHVKK